MKVTVNKKRSTASAESASDKVARPKKSRFRRLRVVLVLAVVVALGWGGQLLWQRVAPDVIRRDRYLLPAEAITATPPPAWIVADVRGQVIVNSGLDRQLSIVNENFVQEIQNAFALHPWVESVGRIEKSFPPAVSVELTFRQPVAVIETTLNGVVQLLPVDRHGVSLPAGDVPEIKKRYLPRVSGVVGQPPAGQRWDDPRVSGAVDLAARLLPDWERLYLTDILPSARPEISGPRRYFVYDLVTRGGTRIVWGAAPLDSPPGEAEFAAKFERLNHFVLNTGPLNSVRSPKIVDVRRETVQVTPRTAKKPSDSQLTEAGKEQAAQLAKLIDWVRSFTR